MGINHNSRISALRPYGGSCLRSAPRFQIRSIYQRRLMRTQSSKLRCDLNLSVIGALYSNLRFTHWLSTITVCYLIISIRPPFHLH